MGDHLVSPVVRMANNRPPPKLSISEIMKAFIKIFFVLLFFRCSCSAQYPTGQTISIYSTHISPLCKPWVGLHGEKLNIDKIHSELMIDSQKYVFYISFNDSLLTMELISGRSPGDPWVYYNFSILKMNDDTLALMPENDNARNLFNTSKAVVFYNKLHLYDRITNFQKIFYSSSGGWDGDIENIKLEIDSTGIYHYWGVAHTTDLDGYWEGKLTDNQIKDLKEILNNIQLKSFISLPYHHVLDAGTSYLKIYFNNINLNVNGSRLPKTAIPLLKFLNSIIVGKKEKSKEKYIFNE